MGGLPYQRSDPWEIGASNIPLDPLGTWGGAAENVQDALEELESSISTENLWDRATTILSPHNAGDSVTASFFTSNTATGTAPIQVTSTTLCTNLNADLLDSQSGAYYRDSANFTGTNWTDLTDSGETSLHIHDARYYTETEIGTILGGYIKADGTVLLTANWDAGSYEIRSATFESDIATGTAPLVIASTTLVSNLNADLLDSQHGSYYLDSTNFTGTNWTDLTDGGATTLHKHDHGGMDGLADDDHTGYLLATGTRVGGSSQMQEFTNGIKIGGSNNELRFYEGVNYVGFEAPALSADKIWVLPTADGNANEALTTDGAGNLSWAASAGFDLTPNFFLMGG